MAPNKSTQNQIIDSVVGHALLVELINNNMFLSSTGKITEFSQFLKTRPLSIILFQPLTYIIIIP